MNKGKRAGVYLFLIVVSFISAFPLLWMISSATNSSIDIIRGRMLPGTHLLDNFRTILEQQNLGRAMWNSFCSSILKTVLSIAICSVAGYGFEVYHDKGKDILMNILLLAMMLPFVAIMIPLFTMFTRLKLVNTWTAFILPGLATPFLIMMFRQAARSFPTDIIEASRLDGLSELGIFGRIFIPTMKSTFGAAFTITFMTSWNTYMWPKVIFQSEKSITMPMLVSNLKGSYSIDYGVLMLAVLICTIPTGIIFFLLQKSFAEGITGSVK